MSVQLVSEIEFVALAIGILAGGLAGRFHSSGKSALALSLLPVLAMVLMEVFC